MVFIYLVVTDVALIALNPLVVFKALDFLGSGLKHRHEQLDKETKGRSADLEEDEQVLEGPTTTEPAAILIPCLFDGSVVRVQPILHND